jgi:hypothetical protein
LSHAETVPTRLFLPITRAPHAWRQLASGAKPETAPAQTGQPRSAFASAASGAQDHESSDSDSEEDDDAEDDLERNGATAAKDLRADGQLDQSSLDLGAIDEAVLNEVSVFCVMLATALFCCQRLLVFSRCLSCLIDGAE